MQPGKILVNETQLGSRLNRAVDSDRRGEFALLLALLSTDARDMAQFQLNDKALTSDAALRAKFELPSEECLVADLTLDSSPVDNSGQFHLGGTRAFQLMQALKPEAVVTRGSEPLEVQQVLANCELRVRQRYSSKSQADPYLPEGVHFVDQLSRQRQMSHILA
ncbi:VC2046/SO_2500 family protein [uncultured Shewanella sp.]|uniref:VC2046/SO_2500 family protein n=1 Tax=Shewanella atlantica TaxID=271099 RepID=UPI0026148C07|nr:VC2046/SO_2500 family protein [uncultured Shewanella sp.]